MARPDRAARRLAWRGGRRAEWLAAIYLRIRGYRVLARNIDTPNGEIDLLARRGDLLVFVEVKQRARPTEPGGVVTRAQQQRIARAAAHIVGRGRYSRPGDGMRFDVIVLTPGRWPVHLLDAWRP